MVTSSETMLQFPLVVLSKVRVRVPAAISAAEGEYVAVKLLFEGVNVPDPPSQTPPPAIVTDPFSEASALFAQTAMSVPASTVGAAV